MGLLVYLHFMTGCEPLHGGMLAEVMSDADSEFCTWEIQFKEIVQI